jgi:hypothetical protein
MAVTSTMSSKSFLLWHMESSVSVLSTAAIVLIGFSRGKLEPYCNAAADVSLEQGSFIRAAQKTAQQHRRWFQCPRLCVQR